MNKKLVPVFVIAMAMAITGCSNKKLMEQQENRKKEAAREFDKRMQEKHEIRPEDREDFWK